jgi:hypothetical protein
MTGDRPPEHQGRLTGPCGGLDNWVTRHPTVYMVPQVDANVIQPTLATIPHVAMERPM